jgi:hypothetical protein
VDGSYNIDIGGAGTSDESNTIRIGDKIAAQQREIDALRQQNASVNALSQRLAVLEQQIRTATPPGLRSLASK